MLNSVIKKGIYLIVFLLTNTLAFGQVTVNINSGNPNFPFPQFLSYDFGGTHSLGNLATNNAPGVVHAEMEKIIREAWQIEANRYTYTGESWAGVNYILSNIGCPYDCSEGVGYGMIAAAYMADKTTFDGIWMREHDLRRALQQEYRTGAIIRPGYKNGNNTIAEPGGDAATDGDVDIALGLLMAWKQWGEFSGYVAFNGQPISYKKEALDVIKGFVERKNSGYMSGSVPDCRSLSGNVGFDGYLKNGNTGPGETTTFGSGDPLWCPEFGGPNDLHIDYAAPSYFYSFRDVMTAESMDPWEINQMYRAEASNDWLMGKMLDNPKIVPHAGYVQVIGSTVTFKNYNLGEDFRAAWRTILNYVWHGDPTYTWDPVTHTVQNGVPNSFEQLIGKRFSSFVEDERKAPWGNPCKDFGGGPNLTYYGTPGTSPYYNPNTAVSQYPLILNYGMATSTPSIIAAQNYDLMGDMFRQCAITWESKVAGDRYITSVPVYFHGFFRLLGMMILSGNFQDPLVAKPIANLKIYRAVDKTYGYTGDQFQFNLSYRNYGTVSATGVKIVETLPADFDYVPGSASNGGVYDAGTHSITWMIATGVPGFTTVEGIPPTQGVQTYKLKAGTNAEGRYCASATITATNSKSWTTNEYPNNVTEVMERNCIDIVKRALLIDKYVNYAKVQENTEVKFKIDFENTATAGWINGGRPNVFVSYAQSPDAANGQTRGINVRLFHGAAEPYINYKNYRISLFLNDNTYNCVKGVGACAVGWTINPTIYEGGVASGVTFSQESITPGQDARGKWNQRVIIQFADQLGTTTPHLSGQAGNDAIQIHKGGKYPLRAVWDLTTSNNAAIDWSDDWSWDPAASDDDAGNYFPVTNDWTDPYNMNIPVTKWHKNACEIAGKTVDNILVEEWDGYVWRRAYGNGPLPGRDVANVIIQDTLPLALTFNGWVQQTTLGISATYNPASRVITWTIPKLQVGQKGSLEYKAIATFTTLGACPKADQKHTNSAWIQGDSESKIADTANVTITCDDVILPPVPTTMTKTADKAAYTIGNPINYTIAYTQTHGAIIDASMSTAADWTQQIGTWNFGTKVSNATQNSPSLIVHKKAHGTNGTITGTLQLAASANFAIVLRQSGTTIASASYVTFKANPGGGVIDIGVWNGTTLIQSQTIGYPGANQDFKIVLNGNQLNLWVGSLTGSPTMTVTGVTVKAGYIGFLNGNPLGADNWAVHSVLALHSEMDSAWDIIISDPTPAGITFGTATGGTNTAGVISWPSIAGPVLYGTVITKTWSGTVTTCAASGKIVNNAFANMLGQATNSIAAQSVVTCGGGTSCVAPTTVTISTTTPVLCKGAALTIKGAAAPANTNYFYTWFRNGIAVTTASKTYIDYTKLITAMADSGIYTLRVEDGNASTLSCYKENSVRIRIDTLPVAGKINSSQEICVGSAAVALTGTASTGGISIKNYKWQRSTISGTGPWTNVSVYSSTGTGYTPGMLTATTYYRRVDSSGVCATAVTNVDTIRVNNKPILSKIIPAVRDTVCIGENFNLSTSINLADSTGVHASINGGYYFTWKHYQAGVLKSTSGPLPYKKLLAATKTAVLSDSGVYDLIVQDGKRATKCMDTISIRIVVNQSPIGKGIIEKHQEICLGNAAAMLTQVAAPKNYIGSPINYQWYSTTDSTSAVLNKLTASINSSYTPGNPTNSLYFVRKDSVKYCSAVKTNFVKVRVNNSPILNKIIPIENDTLCESAGSIFQLKGLVDSSANASLNKGYYFTWKKLQQPSTIPVVVGAPSVYADYPPVSRLAVEADSGTYYLIVQDGAGATVCMDTLVSKVVVFKNCAIIPPSCKKPISVSIKQVGGNDTLCSGNSLHLKIDVIDTLPNLTGAYYFSWVKQNALGTTVLVSPSSTYSDLILPTVAEKDSGKYYLIVQDGLSAPSTCITNSTAISIVVHKPITIPAVIATSDTICAGTTPKPFTEFTPSVGSTGTPYKYQWYESTDSFKTVGGQSMLVGATMQTYQAPVLSSTTYFMRVDSVGFCQKVATNIVTIRVDQPVGSGVIGSDTIVCSGSPLNLFVEFSASTGGTGTFLYQWKNSLDNTTYTDISGAIDKEYQSPNLNTTTYFKRIDSSGVCSSKQTNIIKVIVLPGVDPGTTSSANAPLCYNTKPPFAILSTSGATGGTGGPGSETYQWQQSTDNVNWTDVTGANGLSYAELNTLKTTTYYRRRVGMGAGSCDTAYTLSIAINVYAPLDPGSIPTETTICSGNPVSIVELTSATGGGNESLTTYEWIHSTNKGLTWVTDATTVNYDTPVLTDSIWYQRIAKATCKTDTTNVMKVHVNAINIVDVHIDPSSTCVGVDVTFTSTYTGEGITPQFEWFTATSNAGPWTLISGANNFKYSVVNPQLAQNETLYKVTLVSSVACTSGNAESTAALAVNDVIAPVVEISASPGILLCDTTKTISYTATPTQGQGINPSYQWYNGQTNLPILGETAVTYTPAAKPANGDQVYVVMKSDLVCANPITATSNKIMIDVRKKPVSIIATKDTIVCTPAEVILRATGFTSGQNQIQWYKNGAIINKATNSMYTVTANDFPGATYTISENNGACSTTSKGVQVKILASPSAEAGVDVYAVEGEQIQLSGSVSINTTYYLWIPSGGLSDAYILNPTLTAPDITTTYSLVAYNNSNYCSSGDIVTVHIERRIKVPNVITVNGDGVNDIWDIDNIENYPNAEFLIYNRWGNLVWKSTGYSKQWDGTNYRNGEVLPDGTYFFIINLHSVKVKDTVTGWVQLIK